jgi:hypothetical protein
MLMGDDDADRLVARAIESVLDQVPGALDTDAPEGAAAKLQPWAETAAPAGHNKRPLEDLLLELAASVAADPGARASLPGARHPRLAFFDRFGREGGTLGSPARGGDGAGSAGRRRRRRRGGATGAGHAEQPAATTAAPAGGQVERPPGGRRRSRRGGGGGGGTPASTVGQGSPAGGPPRSAGGQPRPPGRGGGERPAAG